MSDDLCFLSEAEKEGVEVGMEGKQSQVGMAAVGNRAQGTGILTA